MAQITLNTQNEDGDPVTHTLHIEDEHSDDEAPVLEQLATRAERVHELRSDLNEQQDENEALREMLVNDIVRRKKLAGEFEGEDTPDEEDEVEYLEALPADRLQMEWDRAPEDLNTSAGTKNKTPDDSTTNGVYGDAAHEV